MHFLKFSTKLMKLKITNNEIMKTINYQAIENYIFECLDFSCYEKQPVEKGEQIAFLLKICRREKRHYNYKTERQMFVDWCYGLPSAFNMDYQQFRVLELCKQFGLTVPKNDYDLFDFWYGKLYDSIIYLNKQLNKIRP